MSSTPVVKGDWSFFLTFPQAVPFGIGFILFLRVFLSLDRAALVKATGGIIHLRLFLSRDSMTNFEYWSEIVRHSQ